ncbi:MAG: hypothetical protein JWP12_1292 [Bacteroidetes bacterium]|nr:hypothetical protein [Bacteroidota bacterium]
MVLGCKNTSIKNEPFFSEYKSNLGLNPEKRQILTIDSLFYYQKNPAYKFEFTSWQGIEVNDKFIANMDHLKGYIFLEKNKIYFKTNIDEKDTNKFLLFNFDMNIGAKYINEIDSSKINYSFELEDIFINSNDSIFKFKYYDVTRNKHGKDLVCYVDKQKGILGMYFSYFNYETNKDEIDNYVGQIYDYNKLKHASHIIIK